MVLTPGTSADAQALRARLRRSWYGLFAHHPSLRPIQLAGIGPLLDGVECLLCAPTAGGKTEALVAAALEHAAGRSEHGPEVVYVCPTRALVNDVFRRLSPIAHRLHVKVGRHTADHRPDPDRLPDVLITTPEGLDSRLCRQPGTLRSTTWLLLDELHLLAGTLRGDQLAALVQRLRVLVRAAAGHLSVAGASATLAHPEAVADRYLVGGRVIAVPPTRRDLSLLARSSESIEGVVAALCEVPGKTLVFANSRNEVEALAQAMRGRAPFGDGVFAHHGSLLKAERERVEAAFLGRKNALCVATNTLELGIDIGDVDRVALLGPPADVSSFVQRIGRAGRRTNAASVLLLADSPAAALRFAFLVDRAGADDLCADLPAYHPVTAVQQAGSLLMQNKARTLAPAALLERLPPWQARFWTPRLVEETLESRPDLFKRQGSVFTVGDALDDAFTRGTMHSLIDADPGGVMVYDALTQRPIGRVERIEKGDGLTLGGSATRVVGRRGNDVWVEGAREGMAAKFRLARGPILGASDARRYVEFLGAPPGHGALLPGYWVHGLGLAQARVVGHALRALGCKTLAVGPLAFGLGLDELEMRLPPTDLPLDALDAGLARHQAGLARLTGQGADFKHLPAEVRDRALRWALPPETLRDRWRALRWTPVPPDAAARLLAVLEPDAESED